MQNITTRQQEILRSLVEEYTRTATPVASRAIAKKYGFDMSPATMRNEFAALERAGLIRKPHTSGGRIPTDKGYRLYVGGCMEDRARIAPRDARQLSEMIARTSVSEDGFHRAIARMLAALSAETALVSDTGHDFYYTGFSHLVEKPEFESAHRLTLITRALDHLDELIPTLLADTADETSVLIGSENPLSDDCSLIISRYAHGDTEGIIAIVGPTRMHYGTNIGLIQTTVQLIKEHDRLKHNTTK